jgi:hypothetical protein
VAVGGGDYTEDQMDDLEYIFALTPLSLKALKHE